MKNITFLLLLMPCCLVCQAQDYFTSADSSFFQKQSSAIENWLGQIGIDSTHIENLTLQVDSNRVLLSLFTPEAQTWANLRHAYQTANQRGIEEDILQKIVFLCEIQPDQAVLQVFGAEYKMKAFFDPAQNYQINIEENVLRLSLTSRGEFVMPPYRKTPLKGTWNSQKSLAESRDRVIEILSKYYEKKKAFFYMGRAQVEVRKIGDNRATLRISNLKGEVVPDLFRTLTHYELVIVQLSLKPDGTRILYECIVDAKHGASIITAPRNHEYQDLEKSYQKLLHAYNHKLIVLLKKGLIGR